MPSPGLRGIPGRGDSQAPDRAIPARRIFWCGGLCTFGARAPAVRPVVCRAWRCFCSHPQYFVKAAEVTPLFACIKPSREYSVHGSGKPRALGTKPRNSASVAPHCPRAQDGGGGRGFPGNRIPHPVSSNCVSRSARMVCTPVSRTGISFWRMLQTILQSTSK